MMKEGKYYIGDLCYVMHGEWDEFCSLTIDGHNCKDGEFQLKDGRKFATYGTAFGDGCYNAREHGVDIGECGVDAGLIGCILLSDIKDIRENNIDGGVIVDFPAPFETSEEGGVIYIGHIAINTNWDDEDDEPDVDEEQEWHDYDPDC